MRKHVFYLLLFFVLLIDTCAYLRKLMCIGMCKTEENQRLSRKPQTYNQLHMHISLDVIKQTYEGEKL